ncbi:RpiR family transcriptional regulator [Mycobacterium paraense]|uniref:RpiR family transcriptional regulator n=1 Tax=Mycobacterium paraense TaxID=767916 RepID=A0A1X2ABD5_9MYCO|nr:MurR/RpiR family transcriptional regulator [Mycobacterium paraense]ORW48123.1 RpiR family transcriptional regulator [Mycobacterium paraense]
MTSTEARPPSGSVVAHIRAALPNLTPRAQAIGQAVLDDPRAIIHLTVSDLAERTATSVASVVRFCQDIGLRGYADLKIRLAADTIPAEETLHEGISPTDDARTVLKKVLADSQAAVAGAADTIDSEQFESAVAALSTASRVLCVGVGTSAPLAQDAGYRLRTIGLSAEAPADGHVQHVAARLLKPGSVCLCFSHTGQTSESLMAVEGAREAGATTIAITSFYRSPLSELCDVVLVAGAAETDVRMEATTSRIAHIAVFDALHTAVLMADLQRASDAQGATADALTRHRI